MRWRAFGRSSGFGALAAMLILAPHVASASEATPQEVVLAYAEWLIPQSAEPTNRSQWIIVGALDMTRPGSPVESSTSFIGKGTCTMSGARTGTSSCRARMSTKLLKESDFRTSALLDRGSLFVRRPALRVRVRWEGTSEAGAAFDDRLDGGIVEEGAYVRRSATARGFLNDIDLPASLSSGYLSTGLEISDGVARLSRTQMGHTAELVW